MSTVPVLPDTAPFSAEQRAWLNGFIAGILSRGPAPAPASPAHARTPAESPLLPLTVLFGSQTGTAESLAKQAAKAAGRRGFAATVRDLAGYSLTQLAQERNVLLITSTFGDGEPPDNAKALHAALASPAEGGASALAGVRFSVCALGDANYTQFCKCGQDFDAFLEQHGARRVAPRVDCDLDPEQKFSGWLDAALSALAAESGRPAPMPGTSDGAAAPEGAPLAAKIEAGFSRARPFAAPLLASRLLNGAGSAKEVRQVEFSLAGSGLSYEAGDALGVFPHNCPELVAELLALLGCDGEEEVPAPDGSTTSLRRALCEQYDLAKPSPELLARFAPATAGAAVEYSSPPLPQVIDVLLARRDLRPSPAELVAALRKLQPRLYSISSSPRAHPGQVHLTVGAVRYELGGRRRKGVCSTFLADRVVPGESRVGVFVHANASFRLPAAADTPTIMVGPGTGIAPFRAFLHERRAAGARGRNWLFFGDQHAASDFLYREELAQLAHDGTLTRLDTAFSRDQTDKVYVQHRMLEHAAELFAWLETGAHFYVCGDATRMAKDVDQALHTIIAQRSGKTIAQAAEYVQALKAAKRYARDVY